MPYLIWVIHTKRITKVVGNNYTLYHCLYKQIKQIICILHNHCPYCLEVRKILDKILKVKLCYLIHSLSFDTVTLYLFDMNGFKAISKHCLPSRPMYLCLVFLSLSCVFTTSKREIRQNMYLGFDTNLHNCWS